MSTLIDAIDRYEAALRSPGPGLDDAESALWEALNSALSAEDHEAVCAPSALGCTEGIAHRGTIYAPGPGFEGWPRVILMRRVRQARDIRP
jgi:hypothetical protein